jgi:hypothetical protein
MTIETLKLALEAMEYADACLKKQLTTKTKHEYAQDLLMDAGVALRTAIAEAEKQEPDYWRRYGLQAYEKKPFEDATALYTTPPAAQRKQLIDRQITRIIDSMPGKFSAFMKDWDLYEFARAVEAAHGIGEKK